MDCGPSWHYYVSYPSRLCEVCAGVEDDDNFLSCLSIRFTVNKMILKYQSGQQYRHERRDETSREGIVRYNKSKPDDFLRAKYMGHMMGGSRLIGFLQILKGWKRKATRTTSSSGELASHTPIRGHAKRYHTQMAVFWPWLQWGPPVRLAAITKGHGIAPFVSQL